MSEILSFRANKETRAALKKVKTLMLSAGHKKEDVTTTNAVRFAIKLAAEARKEAP